jgi:hypothetical protein
MKPAKMKSRHRAKGIKKTNRWQKKGKPSKAANPR